MKILSLNVGAFPKLFECCFDVVKNAEDRCKKLADILINIKLQYDIICFQEIWSKTCYKILVDKLKNIYPHYTNFYNTCIKLGSGLVIFSKYEIVNEYKEDFNDYRGHGSLAHKGFLMAEIKYVGHIINTHMQAGKVEWLDKLCCKNNLNTRIISERQYTQILNYIGKNIPANKVVYIIGDINIAYKSDEYNDMEELMSAFKFSNSTHYPLYHSTIYNQQKIIDYCFTKNIEVTTGIDDIITEQIADHKALTITLTKLL